MSQPRCPSLHRDAFGGALTGHAARLSKIRQGAHVGLRLAFLGPWVAQKAKNELVSMHSDVTHRSLLTPLFPLSFCRPECQSCCSNSIELEDSARCGDFVYAYEMQGGVQVRSRERACHRPPPLCVCPVFLPD